MNTDLHKLIDALRVDLAYCLTDLHKKDKLVHQVAQLEKRVSQLEKQAAETASLRKQLAEIILHD